MRFTFGSPPHAGGSPACDGHIFGRMARILPEPRRIRKAAWSRDARPAALHRPIARGFTARRGRPVPEVGCRPSNVGFRATRDTLPRSLRGTQSEDDAEGGFEFLDDQELAFAVGIAPAVADVGTGDAAPSSVVPSVTTSRLPTSVASSGVVAGSSEIPDSPSGRMPP